MNKLLTRFPFNLFNLFNSACNQRGLSMAGVIRMLVEKWLFEIGVLDSIKFNEEMASRSNINRNSRIKKGIEDI